jgi:hypothetical protein
MVMAGVGAISVMLLVIMVIALVMVKPGEVIDTEADTTQSGMDLI